MKLGGKQRRFTLMVARLILHAEMLGYRLTFGDAYRDPRVTYGHPESVHRKRLGIDLNMFIKDAAGRWQYITDGTGHDKLHDYWDSIGGAERIDDDMNHYSISHGGVR